MIHIDQFSFGKIVVDGKPYNGDIKIAGGKVISGWWRRSGHRVDVEDIQDILDTGPEVVVIGMGSPGLMKATDALRKILKKKGIRLSEETSDMAVDTFNRLAMEGRGVAGCFHVGC